MNRTVVIAMGVAALAGAGVAIAGALGTSSVDPVSATLAVNGAVETDLQACTAPAGIGKAGTIGVNATATSTDTALTGPAQLMLRGSIDTDANAGTFTGTLRINTTPGPDTLASFSGVYANGELHGLLTGRSPFTNGKDLIQRPFDRLVANLSANLNPSTGQLSSIKIGATDSGGPAVLIEPGSSCKPSTSAGGKPPSRPKP